MTKPVSAEKIFSGRRRQGAQKKKSTAPPVNSRKRKPPGTRISVRIGIAQRDALDQFAINDGMPFASQVQRAIAEYIERRNQTSPTLQN